MPVIASDGVCFFLRQKSKVVPRNYKTPLHESDSSLLCKGAFVIREVQCVIARSYYFVAIQGNFWITSLGYKFAMTR